MQREMQHIGKVKMQVGKEIKEYRALYCNRSYKIVLMVVLNDCMKEIYRNLLLFYNMNLQQGKKMDTKGINFKDNRTIY